MTLFNHKTPAKRWTLIKPFAVTCLFVFAISFAIFLIWTAPPMSIIESPDKTYVLNLRGHRSGPSFPPFVHSVSLDVYKRGVPVVRGQELHSGDWFDPGFDDLYREYTWINSSTLMFHDGRVEAENRDTLNVTNNTSKPIKFLQIKSFGLFLLFDLKPQARAQLSAFSQPGMSWIAVQGEFEDGTSIPSKEFNFTSDPNLEGPFTYEVAITDSGPIISSSRLREYRP